MLRQGTKVALKQQKIMVMKVVDDSEMNITQLVHSTNGTTYTHTVPASSIEAPEGAGEEEIGVPHRFLDSVLKLRMFVSHVGVLFHPPIPACHSLADFVLNCQELGTVESEQLMETEPHDTPLREPAETDQREADESHHTQHLQPSRLNVSAAPATHRERQGGFWRMVTWLARLAASGRRDLVRTPSSPHHSSNSSNSPTAQTSLGEHDGEGGEGRTRTTVLRTPQLSVAAGKDAEVSEDGGGEGGEEGGASSEEGEEGEEGLGEGSLGTWELCVRLMECSLVGDDLADIRRLAAHDLLHIPPGLGDIPACLGDTPGCLAPTSPVTSTLLSPSAGGEGGSGEGDGGGAVTPSAHDHGFRQEEAHEAKRSGMRAREEEAEESPKRLTHEQRQVLRHLAPCGILHPFPLSSCLEALAVSCRHGAGALVFRRCWCSCVSRMRRGEGKRALASSLLASSLSSPPLSPCLLSLLAPLACSLLEGCCCGIV